MSPRINGYHIDRDSILGRVGSVVHDPEAGVDLGRAGDLRLLGNQAKAFPGMLGKLLSLTVANPLKEHLQHL